MLTETQRIHLCPQLISIHTRKSPRYDTSLQICSARLVMRRADRSFSLRVGGVCMHTNACMIYVVPSNKRFEHIATQNARLLKVAILYCGVEFPVHCTSYESPTCRALFPRDFNASTSPGKYFSFGGNKYPGTTVVLVSSSLSLSCRFSFFCQS
ncbi:unnamed protein product, partial [Ectocarpus sp. 12 AP-2014]